MDQIRQYLSLQKQVAEQQKAVEPFQNLNAEAIVSAYNDGTAAMERFNAA
ncbi:MAG: hypothetical protein Q4E13_12330 [Clostridia bacterium]|nr:hypothetical protein [Clostridia bacterium]